MEPLPSTPVPAAISTSNTFSIPPASPNTGGRPDLQLSPNSKKKRLAQQRKEANKRFRAAKKAKLDSIPELEKTIFDNLLQHQKEKDALGSEISELKDTLSVTEEMLKEATTRAEEADSKRADCVKNINKEIKAAVNDAIDHERKKSKKDQEKLIADNCELKNEVEAQRQILHLSDIAREEVAEKGNELSSQVEKLSQKLSSQVMAIVDFTALRSQTIHLPSTATLLFGVVSQFKFSLCLYELTWPFILTFRSAKQNRI
jgi:chromosome segregation ATPase